MTDRVHVLRGKYYCRWLQVAGELTKARITVVVTLSVAMGYLLFAKTWTTGVLLPVAGTFLLACGAAALNQVQEARLDARMPRTRDRPIPAGRIGRDGAALLAVALLGTGLTVLASVETHTLTLLALGALAVVWYNGLYVLLKRVTPFAVVPGALIGAIPPVIGWVAAGGLFNDPTILAVAFFFFLWQIPHFWLLLIRHGRDYQQAGLPSLTGLFSPAQLARITCIWIWSLATCGILMATTGGIRLPWDAVIVAACLWLAGSALSLLRNVSIQDCAIAVFIRINVYMLIVMAALVGNAMT